MVTIVVMLFLIATVVFVLSQMLNVSSGNVIDGQRQGDSTAAFFLAESGLDKAKSVADAALSAGNFTNATCTGIATNYNLGRGSVGLTAVSTPATCTNGGGTPCTVCTVTSVGRVGVTQRTATQDLVLTTVNGIFCNAGITDCSNTPTVTWELKLKNTAAVAGIGLFNLTYEKQGNNIATCAPASNCRLQQDLTSPSSGINSTGLMGNAVLIPAGSTYPIYQTMSKGDVRSLAEVGAFFLGTSAPVLTGPTTSAGAAAYWDDDKNNTTSRTVGASGMSTGGSNDGTATTGGTCSAPSAHSQGCTSWCYGGDTLAFSFAGNVTLLTDALSGVTFGTNASTGQNIAMTRIAKYPSSVVTGAPRKVDAEIWYARNPNFTGSSPLALNASSYKGRGSGAVGAAWTTTSATDTSITGTTLTVGNGFTGYPAKIISVNDTVVSTGVAANTTIVQQLTSTESGGMATMRGGRGTYQVSISQTVTGANGRAWTVNSNVLNVTACTICYFAQNDAIALAGLSAGRTINAAQTTATTYGRTEAFGGLGRYSISGTATQVASSSALYAGTPGTTVYLPSTSSQPAVTTPAMLITVKSGTGGVLPPGTTVTAVSAPNVATTAFTVSTAPTTALDGASVCGGTCAFFVPGTNTTFSLGGITSNFNEWAAGFMCMKGVDLPPDAVTSAITVNRRWTEPVQ